MEYSIMMLSFMCNLVKISPSSSENMNHCVFFSLECTFYIYIGSRSPLSKAAILCRHVSTASFSNQTLALKREFHVFTLK